MGFSPACRNTVGKPLGQGFDSRLAQKKKPSLVPCPKHSWGPAFLTGNSHYVWVWQGFGGFIDLCEKVVFLVQCHGGSLPPQVKVFFYNNYLISVDKKGPETKWEHESWELKYYKDASYHWNCRHWRGMDIKIAFHHPSVITNTDRIGSIWLIFSTYIITAINVHIFF